MNENLINCPNCTYICDVDKVSDCPSCGSSLSELEERYETDLGEVLDGVDRTTHAVRAIGLFLILGALMPLSWHSPFLSQASLNQAHRDLQL